MKIRIKKNNVIEEMSAAGAGAVQGYAGSSPSEREDLREEELDEMFSTAATMGSGSGRIPAERSKEGHKRYIRMRFVNQGLQNFKPNRYFAEKKNENKNN
jgi:hypothetical protein